MKRQIFKNCLFLFVFVLFFGFAKAYPAEPTHPLLAEKSGQIFKQFYSGDLTAEEINWLKQGAIEEDISPRWVNHFFDPITGLGWQGQKMGVLPALALLQFSKIAISSKDAVSSLNWAKNQELQQKYSLYKGDQTWQKAISEYNKGNKKQAFLALGHILHLLEDLAVPAHTRQDTHFDFFGLGFTTDPGEPYEKWTIANNNFSHLIGKPPDFNCENLDDCFLKLAKYSNENFFSENTILDKSYELPSINYYKKTEDKKIRYGYDNFGNILVMAILDADGENIKELTLKNDNINSAYWQRLSEKAVFAGAELIDIFFKEAEKAKKQEQIEPAFSKTRAPVVSLVGELDRLRKFAVNGYQSLKNKVSNLFNGFLPASLFEIPALKHYYNPDSTKTEPDISHEDQDDFLEEIDSLSQEIKKEEQDLEEKNEPEKEDNKENEENSEGQKSEEEKENGQEQTENQEQDEQNETQSFCQNFAGAVQSNKIIINEIAWMGTNSSANDEWIELKNISGGEFPIDLAGWQILSKDSDIKIIFKNPALIPSSGFYLLERTDDNTVPDILADKIYTGALNNENEDLYVFDQNCEVQDYVSANPNWQAGDNVSKRTMERKNNLFWQTSRDPGGTPKAENSSGYVPPSFGGGGGGGSGGSDSGDGDGGGDDDDKKTSYSKILISEIQISEKDNEKQEFVELYNPNEQDIDLTGWYLQRKTKSAGDYSSFAPANLFEGKTIKARDYFLISREGSSFVGISDIITDYPLTEDNTLVLKNPNREISDKVGWGEVQDFEGKSPALNPEEDKSVGRAWFEENADYFDRDENFEDFEIQTPTPKAKNRKEEPPIPEPEITPKLNAAINEIAWMGTRASASDEWIELRNNTKSEISLLGWRLESSDEKGPAIVFEDGEKIGPLGYFLIERTNDEPASESADWTGSFGNGLSNADCEILSLYDRENNLIDKAGCLENGEWPAGMASPDYISAERINPLTSGNNKDNWADNNGKIKNGFDAKGNEINGTPKAQNSAYVNLAPEAIADLAIDEQKSFGKEAVLVWTAPDDADTLKENLRYEIRYLKDEEIKEENWESAEIFENPPAILSAGEAQTATVSLDYSAVYYIAIKTLDGSNYSLTSNSAYFKTATLSTIASGFPTDFETSRSARKIARNSKGELFAAYSQDDKIFLAKSENQGKSWRETPVAGEQEFEQKNPSIAIDSQDKIHIAWSGRAAGSNALQIRYLIYENDSFGEIKNLTDNGQFNQEMPVVAVDSRDIVHILWVNKASRMGRDDMVNAPEISYANSADDWQNIERAGSYDDFVIYSISMEIDRQDFVNLVWTAMMKQGDMITEQLVRYQKRAGVWSEVETVDLNRPGLNSSQMVFDGSADIHFVWNGNCQTISHEDTVCYISRKKYGDLAGEKLSSSNSLIPQSASVAIDNSDNLYAVWSQFNPETGKWQIYTKKRSDFWREIKILEAENDQKYPSVLWSFYPKTSGKKTNQPKSGFALIFYEDGNLKFFASQDLAWE